MAEKLEIEVVIGADGRVVMETRGLKGQECALETAQLEKALGKVIRREKTREWYQRAAGVKGTVRRR